MNVLHVLAPAAVGGLERVVQTLAAAQRADGDDVRVAAVFPGGARGAGTGFCAPLRAAGVDVHAIDVPHRGYLQERAAVAQLCTRYDVDVLHTHGYRSDIVNAGPRHAAHVTTAHGFTGGGLGNRVYEWMQRRTFRRLHAVVAVARPLASELVRSGVPARRVHLVANAWGETVPRLDRASARRELGVAGGAFVIGWAGRVSREKGLDVLLAALPHLGDFPWCLHVIGDGRERAGLERAALRRHPKGTIVWHGVVPAAERLFAAFDVFVLSSRTEGTPIVLFEAIAAGVPVVATMVGGIGDVTSADGALLVKPCDSRGVGAALRDVYRNPGAAAVRARAADARLRREYAIDGWGGRYRGVYAAALEERGARP
ncbi:MAG TPA: glycosyltransferase family 4 protein [Gemmatimonadaceae bacterium]|nr:glycosyltransferase family 4 protein [Gemmatimonadaceae bacterium]